MPNPSELERLHQEGIERDRESTLELARLRIPHLGMDHAELYRRLCDIADGLMKENERLHEAISA